MSCETWIGVLWWHCTVLGGIARCTQFWLEYAFEIWKADKTEKLKAVMLARSKVVPYLITSIGFGADPSSPAVSPQVTFVINIYCHYFPPGPQLLYQPKRSPPWPVSNYTAWSQRHTGVSSLTKATMQWCPARTWTCNLWIATPLPCQ